jgi:hypothetical protein
MKPTAPVPLAEPRQPIAVMETGYENQPLTKVPSWHGLIAWDVLLNGMATGLFMAAAICELAAPAIFAGVAKVAYPVALVLLLVDLTMLVFDLGDPLRFHHMLRMLKLHSPMSVGTWCLTIFSLPLTAAALLSVAAEFGFDFERARILAVIAGLLPAFGSAAYKGVLLSINAQPGWKDARWMGGYLTNSALLIGASELLALSALRHEVRAGAILRMAVLVLLVLNLIPLARLFANLRPTFARLYSGEQQWVTGALIFFGGTLVPLGLTFRKDTFPFVLGALIFLLVASWIVRFIYVKIPHAALVESKGSQ